MNSCEQRNPSRIPLRDALKTLADARQPGDVVITNQGSSRVWPLIAEHPLDFHFNPSTMGGAIPFAVGLALAKPARNVMVLTGDGSLLMSLGSLVTVIGAKCTNLTIVLLDNQIYDVTGGQKTVASNLAVNYEEMARSIGYPSVGTYQASEEWKAAAAQALQATGPRFIWLRVEPALRADMGTVQEPIADQMARVGALLDDD